MIDLHTHTTYSDGRATPREVIGHAREIGLTALAITDHNNARGAREGEPIAREAGLTLLPAIELYVNWTSYDGTIDLLGYGLDIWDARFQQVEREALADLEDRIAECCRYLAEEGYSIPFAEVRAVNPAFAGHVQVGLALKARGLIQEMSEMDRLFKLTWPRVRPAAIDIADAIALFHDLGGIAVVGHPHQYKREGVNWPVSDLATLKSLGLDGIEAYHRRLRGADRVHFLGAAQELGMLVTGGSDEHGWPSGFSHMGVEPLPDALLDGVLEYLAGVRAR